MNAKMIKGVIVVAIMMFAIVAQATSYVSASGTVHSKSSYVIVTTYQCGNNICNLATYYETLKIEQADGSKVNADCMISDAMRVQCQSAYIGQAASGSATCNGGYCSWNSLNLGQ